MDDIDNASVEAQRSFPHNLEWLEELTPFLEHYWDTGETPDDLDIEWLDAMIAKVEPEALKELRLARNTA